MDDLDVTADVSPEPTHDLVTISLDNRRPDTVEVAVTQPLPEDASPSQVATMSDHEVTVTGDAVEFVRRVDPGTTAEVVYATKGIGSVTIEETLQAASIEVRGPDADSLGTMTGIELWSHGPDAACGDQDDREPGGKPDASPASTDGSGEEADAPLPTTVSEYVLSDISDDIEPADFEWTGLDTGPDREEQAGGPTGLFARIRSWF